MNTNNPQPITSFDGHTNNVTAVGFERDGRWMFSGSEDGTVKIWDLRASGYQREYESRGAVNTVVLHPNQARTVQAPPGKGRARAEPRGRQPGAWPRAPGAPPADACLARLWQYGASGRPRVMTHLPPQS